MVKTPADRWKRTIVGYRKNCQSILAVSENIRYAGAINSYGRTLTGIVRSNVKPLLKTEQAKNEFFVIPTLLNLRKDSSKVLGKMDYVLLQHHKISVIVLQKGEITYYISINKKEKDVGRIIPKIQKII